MSSCSLYTGTVVIALEDMFRAGLNVNRRHLLFLSAGGDEMSQSGNVNG
jgi:hypothetical protein